MIYRICYKAEEHTKHNVAACTTRAPSEYTNWRNKDRETAVLCCGLEKNGMVGAWHGHGTASVNQTRPHCVNQMGKTHSKPLAARPARGRAWKRHGNGMLCVWIGFKSHHNSDTRSEQNDNHAARESWSRSGSLFIGAEAHSVYRLEQRWPFYTGFNMFIAEYLHQGSEEFFSSRCNRPQSLVRVSD